MSYPRRGWDESPPNRLAQRWRPDLVEQHSLGTATMRLLRSRTPDAARRRMIEQAERRRYGRFTVGIELLPTHIVAVLTDATGEALGRRRAELANKRVETVVHKVNEVARELVTTSLGTDLPNRRVAIGLQIGGPVRDGVVLAWRNHPTDPAFGVDPDHWHKPVPLAALIEEESGCRTVVENDAVAYAVYEQRFGVGYQTGSFAVVLVRDGVGGGVVYDHRVLDVPFEIGHLTVQPGGRPCSCGKKGCVESLAGRRAIRGIVGELMGGPTEPDCINQAIDLADGGHERSHDIREIFFQGGRALAQAIATTLAIFAVSHVVVYCDPEMFGTNEGRPAVTRFFEGVNMFHEYTFPPFGECRIARKPWRSTDGALGAALVALNQLFLVPLADLELPA